MQQVEEGQKFEEEIITSNAGAYNLYHLRVSSAVDGGLVKHIMDAIIDLSQVPCCGTTSRGSLCNKRVCEAAYGNNSAWAECHFHPASETTPYVRVTEEWEVEACICQEHSAQTQHTARWLMVEITLAGKELPDTSRYTRHELATQAGWLS